MTTPTPFAREDVMQDYLDSLLTPQDEPDEVSVTAARLLEQASLAALKAVPEPAEVTTVISAPPVSVEPEAVWEEPEEVCLPEPAVIETPVVKLVPPVVSSSALHERLDSKFQALFFEVAGLTLAVPLITLGGIHQLEKIGPLIGKPDWFKGVMLHREQKLSVVDTARWVMPEKCNPSLIEGLDYQYLIMLGDSNWGLASEKLVNTVTLKKDEVKWRESSGKRPWLAGMVKQRMCALIDVEQLISMLNNGLGSNDQMP
ncbi:chemotaxis protein CheW [Alteromonas aestuariivivens]|uniref:Chemotaxis protein CheW n=1 Tax=Alteromonas aestuariivivens TaxID=1938339 RepID=A0A3D8M641_9ALTE|nr:chemotaxis protein CheW [Alteromonas aestuariivivens]RDV25091.1 chemotaxis protein CheW [Alteromonas aestuariivivens]